MQPRTAPAQLEARVSHFIHFITTPSKANSTKAVLPVSSRPMPFSSFLPITRHPPTATLKAATAARLTQRAETSTPPNPEAMRLAPYGSRHDGATSTEHKPPRDI